MPMITTLNLTISQPIKAYNHYTHLVPVPLCLLIPPPPTSTLFPYTTLFRSRGAPSGRGRGRRGRSRHRPQPGHGGSRRPWADRKSTRLNSSHVKISYAVFCLKKKKEILT